MSIEVPVQGILVPGQGIVNVDAMRVDTAVREYDERLRFGYNPTNQDWIIYIALPRDYEGAHYHIDGTPVMPVLGFGDRIPAPSEATRKLYETDAWRHGNKLYDKMLSDNEEQKRRNAEAMEEEIAEAQERIEHAMNYHTGEGTKKVYFGDASGRRRGYHVGKRDGNRS